MSKKLTLAVSSNVNFGSTGILCGLYSCSYIVQGVHLTAITRSLAAWNRADMEQWNTQGVYTGQYMEHSRHGEHPGASHRSLHVQIVAEISVKEY